MEKSLVIEKKTRKNKTPFTPEDNVLKLNTTAKTKEKTKSNTLFTNITNINSTNRNNTTKNNNTNNDNNNTNTITIPNNPGLLVPIPDLNQAEELLENAQSSRELNPFTIDVLRVMADNMKQIAVGFEEVKKHQSEQTQQQIKEAVSATLVEKFWQVCIIAGINVRLITILLHRSM